MCGAVSGKREKSKRDDVLRNVFAFCKREQALGKLLIRVDRAWERATQMTGVSRGTLGKAVQDPVISIIKELSRAKSEGVPKVW
jgi:hypothetical protein